MSLGAKWVLRARVEELGRQWDKEVFVLSLK